MIQDIAPKHYRVAYAPAPPRPEDPCLVFRGKTLLECPRGEGLTVPAWRELAPYAARTQWLFAIDDTPYHLVELTDPEGFPPTCTWGSMRENRRKKTKDLLFAQSTGYHLAQWYFANRFCGRCGSPTRPDDRERMLRCPRCGNLIYPKIAPAVIVALTWGDKILMTRYQGRAYTGYALIAGFTEVGETAEDTVRREVFEEVGLHVKDIRYCGSQPWGIDSNLLLGYFARLDGTEEIHLDRQELSQAAWYRREEIDLAPDDYSLTNHMIQAFRRGDWD